MILDLTRRSFLRVAAATGLTGAIGWLLPTTRRASATPAGGGVIAYRRSGRGRHVSNAAKRKNANCLYATFQAAAQDSAHLGDRSRVVPVVISASLFSSLFRDGRVTVDLRRDLRTLSDIKALQRCMSGPGVPLTSECATTDQDGNGTADLQDFAALQRTFTGR